jgi:hypothetical protein
MKSNWKRPGKNAGRCSSNISRHAGSACALIRSSARITSKRDLAEEIALVMEEMNLLHNHTDYPQPPWRQNETDSITRSLKAKQSYLEREMRRVAQEGLSLPFQWMPDELAE